MKKAKAILCVLLALAMVFSLIACTNSSSGDSTATSSAPANSSAPASATSVKAPESITIGLSGGLGRFLAGIAPSENFTACDAVFDSVFRIDPKTKEVFSDILESWEWKDDTTFVMKMKDNVYFSNGDNATAEDLIFSYAAHPERGSNYLNSFGILMDQCVATDTYTAEFKFEKPYIAFANTIIYLIDKSWSEEVGWDSMEWYQPVGSGPYACTEYVADDHITLEARDDYWNKDAGEIAVKKFIIKNYADRSTMLMDFETGNIQMCQVSADAYSRYLKEGTDGFDCVLIPTGAVLYFNFGFLCNDIWKNQTLREAIACGINWEEMGKLAYGDLYMPAKSLTPAMSPEYIDPGNITYDPEHAKELLAEAGYGAGELKINTYMMDNPLYKNLSEGFQFYAQEIGIDVGVDFGDISTTIAKWVDVNSGIDFGFFYYVPGSPTGNLRANLWNAGDPNGVKWGYFDDDDFQKLFAEHVYTTSLDASIQASKEAQQLAYDRTLAVPICENVTVLGYRTELFTEDQANDFYQGADNWMISKLGLASAWE